MMQQQASFEWVAEGKLETEFWTYHAKHPKVYRELVRFARQVREKRGPDAVVGIAFLYERARWSIWFESQRDEPTPKMSNNHRAYYARLLMERNPDLEGIFRLKRQRVQATFGPGNETLEPNEHIE